MNREAWIIAAIGSLVLLANFYDLTHWFLDGWRDICPFLG